MSKKTKNKKQTNKQTKNDDTIVVDNVEVIEEQSTSEKTEKDYEKTIAELNDKLLRQKAEADNYRKRMQREMTELRRIVKQGTIQEFLPVCDHFQMAVNHAELNADIDTIKQGMNMILTEFNRVFENLGVEKMETVGTKFNPQEHEAISQEYSDEIPKDHITKEWKPGYKIAGKLLRPAGVVVSSGSEKTEK